MNDVVDNRAAGRFELAIGSETAIAAYDLEGDTIVFTHTEVPPALEGQGIGSRLVAGALAQARAAGLKVVPACAFVAAYVRRHLEAADLA
jgi:predicted GNAT family acetyltransferase